ncbi:hypothetical protein D9M72_589980 [compost metagenome]
MNQASVVVPSDRGKRLKASAPTTFPLLRHWIGWKAVTMPWPGTRAVTRSRICSAAPSEEEGLSMARAVPSKPVPVPSAP